MGYLLLVITRFFGRLLAPLIERGWQNATGDPAAVANQRKYEAMVPGLKAFMRHSEWDRLRHTCGAETGYLVKDWQVAEWITVRREAADAARAEAASSLKNDA